MDKLKEKELRRTFSSVLKLAVCPICTETLESSTVQCTNGHPICVSCRLDLQKCPLELCQSPFGNVAPSGFIRHLLEIIPHPCRFPGCTYFVKTNDDHEMFCGFKPAQCKLCEWQGKGQKLLNHVQEKHLDTLEMIPTVLGEGWSSKLDFDPKNKSSVFLPKVVANKLFWMELINDPEAEKCTVVIHCIPNGKTNKVFESCVSIGKYSVRLEEVNLNPDADPYKENCLSIPSSVLHKYEYENTYNHKFSIKKKNWQSFHNQVKCKLNGTNVFNLIKK